MLLRELISQLQALAERFPALEVTVAGHDGPSHHIGPPNQISLDRMWHPTEVHIEYNPTLGDEP